MSEETKRKMSLASKGRKKTEEHRRNISKAKTGVKATVEQRLRMSLAHGGKIENFGNKQYRSWVKNRRNRLKNATSKELGGHTYGEWFLLKIQYGNTCPSCGRSEPTISLTEDHIVPLSKGGTDLIENIQPLCLTCNVRKHTKTIKF